jgi:hypothetical protein
MAETTMLSGGGGGRDQDGRWRRVGGSGSKCVEGFDAITSGERGPGSRILHRKTRGFKLNGTRVVSGEPTDGKEIVSDMWGYENVVEIEWSSEHRGTY